LYVTACFADEGPTLKRWRPRARGRATRIRKRTCHITIIVARMDDDALEIQRVRDEARGGTAATGNAAEERRRRVARSRGEETEAEAASESDSAATEDPIDEVAADEITNEDVVEPVEDVEPDKEPSDDMDPATETAADAPVEAADDAATEGES